MKKFFTKLKLAVNELTTRERSFLMVTGVIILFLLFNHLGTRLLEEKRLLLTEENDAITKQMDLTNRELIMLEAGFDKKVSERDRLEIQVVQNKLRTQLLEIKKLSQSFITTAQIPSLLQVLIKDLSGLILIDLQTQTVNKISNTAIEQDEKMNELHAPSIEIVLTLKGELQQLLSYLQRIEAFSYPINWQELEYRVTEFPQAQIILKMMINIASPTENSMQEKYNAKKN